MTIDAVLARGRAAAARRMRDTVTIRRPGLPTFDPTTGAETATGTAVYAGPGEVKAMSVAAGEAQAGEREITIRTYDVRLPFGTIPSTGNRFAVDDVVTVDACEDPSLVGRPLTVIDPQGGGQRTALHLVAEDRS